MHVLFLMLPLILIQCAPKVTPTPSVSHAATEVAVVAPLLIALPDTVIKQTRSSTSVYLHPEIISTYIVEGMAAHTPVRVVGWTLKFWMIERGGETVFIQERSLAIDQELEHIRNKGRERDAELVDVHAAEKAQRLTERRAVQEALRQANEAANEAIRQANEVSRAKQREEQEADFRKHFASLIDRFGTVAAVDIIKGKIWLGMTEEMAIESLGDPKDINRTVSASGVRKQYVYSLGHYLYFDDGILTSWSD